MNETHPYLPCCTGDCCLNRAPLVLQSSGRTVMTPEDERKRRDLSLAVHREQEAMRAEYRRGNERKKANTAKCGVWERDQ